MNLENLTPTEVTTLEPFKNVYLQIQSWNPETVYLTEWGWKFVNESLFQFL